MIPAESTETKWEENIIFLIYSESIFWTDRTEFLEAEIDKPLKGGSGGLAWHFLTLKKKKLYWTIIAIV